MNYPTIKANDLPKLVQIIEQASADDKYLDPASCPYDEATIKNIKRILSLCDGDRIASATVRPERGKVGRPSKSPAIPIDEVESEIKGIQDELASLKIEGQTMETADRIQVIKTRAALIERVLVMKERVTDIRKFHSFVQTVIGIMEQHLSPKERDSILQELKPYVEI